MHKPVIRALGWIAVAGLIIFGGDPVWRWGSYHMRSIPAYDATPTILRDLPTDAADGIDAEFAARVAAHFHHGMPDANLIAAMQQQGFHADADIGGRRFAYLVQKRGYCLQDCLVHWGVRWTVDRRGRATDISSDYGRVGIPGGLFGDLFDSD